MLRISLTIFLALTAWIHPLTLASAFAEQPLENPQFINYEQFHVAKSTEASPDNQKEVTDRVLDDSKRRNTGKSIPESYSGRNYSKEEVIQLIENYSREYRIKSDAPLCVAKLESGYNQFSKNKSSSASGVFQYIAGTWKATDEGKANYSVFDADANIKAAIKYMASRKSAKPWTVASKCPPITTIN